MRIYNSPLSPYILKKRGELKQILILCGFYNFQKLEL